MQRALQSFFFITGIVFFSVGQAWVWKLTNNDSLAPYLIISVLLTSIALLLVAIYLKEGNQ